MSYHPNYFKSDKISNRKDCSKRLKKIRERVTYGSLVDIGCSGGFYSFGLQNVCDSILAFDIVSELIESCKKIQQEHRTSIDFRVGDVDNMLEIIEENAPWENILYMSIHHHIVRQFGFEKATEILTRLSKSCFKMFFDMGQKNEGCKEHEWWRILPDADNQVQWLTDYLISNTIFSAATVIGSSPVHGKKRYLFELESDKIRFNKTDYYILKVLYRTKGSHGQTLTELVIPETERRRTFYIVQTGGAKYWVKEYSDPSLGHSMKYEYKETAKYGTPIHIHDHNIRAVHVYGINHNSILMEYCDGYEKLCLIKSTLPSDDRKIVYKLLKKWLAESHVKNYDLSANNVMVKTEKGTISVILLDFEYSPDANRPKWKRFLHSLRRN